MLFHFPRPSIVGAGSYTEKGVVQLKADDDCLNRTTSVGSDSLTALFFLSVQFADIEASPAERLIAAASANNTISRLVDQNIDLVWKDTGSTTVVNISNTNDGNNFGAERVNILASMDNNTAATCRLTCRTSARTTTVTGGSGSNVAYDFTNANFAIGATGSASPPGGNRLNATWYRAQLFISPTGGAPDTSQTSVQDYFWNSGDGTLVDPQDAIDQYGSAAFTIDGNAAYWNGDPDGFTSYGSYTDA